MYRKTVPLRIAVAYNTRYHNVCHVPEWQEEQTFVHCGSWMPNRDETTLYYLLSTLFTYLQVADDAFTSSVANSVRYHG